MGPVSWKLNEVLPTAFLIVCFPTPLSSYRDQREAVAELLHSVRMPCSPEHKLHKIYRCNGVHETVEKWLSLYPQRLEQTLLCIVFGSLYLIFSHGIIQIGSNFPWVHTFTLVEPSFSSESGDGVEISSKLPLNNCTIPSTRESDSI